MIEKQDIWESLRGMKTRNKLIMTAVKKLQNLQLLNYEICDECLTFQFQTFDADHLAQIVRSIYVHFSAESDADSRPEIPEIKPLYIGIVAILDCLQLELAIMLLSFKGKHGIVCLWCF